MPFEIIDRGLFMYARLFGTLTRDDLTSVSAEVERLESAGAASKDRITDFTQLEQLQVDFPDVLLLASRRRARRFPRNIRSALVACRPLHFGYARMFQTLNDHPQIEIRIVASMEDAMHWIARAELRRAPQ